MEADPQAHQGITPAPMIDMTQEVQINFQMRQNTAYAILVATAMKAQPVGVNVGGDPAETKGFHNQRGTAPGVALEDPKLKRTVLAPDPDNLLMLAVT